MPAELFISISTLTGSAFKIPIFQLPAAYAARVISVDVYDAGDISGSGNLDINILDPSLSVVTATSAVKVNIYDLGVDRASNPANPSNLISTSNTATYRANTRQMLSAAGPVLVNSRVTIPTYVP